MYYIVMKGGVPKSENELPMTLLTRILFVGIDAGDKDLILQWAESGVLPTIRSLLEKAVWGVTSSPVGVFGGGMWPSFFTGVSPARHGRHCYSQLRRGTYDTYRFRPSDLKWEPFWGVLGRANKRAVILDVPKGLPSKSLKGAQLFDWGTHDPDSDFCTWPTSLAPEVEAQFGKHPVGQCNSIRRDASGYKEFCDALLSGVAKKGELINYFLNQGGWDFFLAVFGESHCAGHQCWHLHDPTHPKHDEELFRSLGDPIKDVYVAIDAAIGRLLQRVGPETIVFVFASHGMGQHNRGTHLLDAILRRRERAGVSSRRRRIADGLAWCWNRIPLTLRKPLMPARDRAKNAFGEALLSPSIASRKCFQVPNNNEYGGIRINLVGREPRGLIRPGLEYDRFCEALSKDLLAVVNLETGEPMILKVLRTADLYHGEHVDDLPDLLLEWNGEAPISAVYSPKIGRVQKEYQGVRTGDHKPEGLFFALGPLGPSIRPARLKYPIPVVDFAPTIASLLGVSLPGAEGQSIAPLIGIDRVSSDRTAS